MSGAAAGGCRTARARVRALAVGAGMVASAGVLPLAHAADPAVGGLTGDVGLGAVHSPVGIRGARTQVQPMPYLNFEWGPVFARIDTLGLQLLPLGEGALELLGQYRGDGYRAPGLRTRADAIPLGLGTLQPTPFGAFGLNVLGDLGPSGGLLVQARYLARFRLGRTTVYPELGMEFENAAYVRYYAGVSGADLAGGVPAYRPGATVNPSLGLLLETPVTERVFLHAYWRETFLGESVRRSPLVTGHERATVLLGLAYRF